MLYPDSKQRTMLGWPIRWVAGLFALLTVAAGVFPAYAEDATDPLLDARNGALYSAEAEERATSGELCPVTGELLGSKSGSESENELEEDDLDSSCALRSVRVLCSRAPVLASRSANRSLASTEATGQSAPRAPPVA